MDYTFHASCHRVENYSSRYSFLHDECRDGAIFIFKDNRSLWGNEHIFCIYVHFVEDVLTCRRALCRGRGSPRLGRDSGGLSCRQWEWRGRGDRSTWPPAANGWWRSSGTVAWPQRNRWAPRQLWNQGLHVRYNSQVHTQNNQYR